MRSPPYSLVTLAALCALSPVSGAGLGQAPGNVTLGQALNMVIPVYLEANETLAAQCVHAEVLLGDVPLSPAYVKAHFETQREGGAARHQVRVTTTVPISEPLLTLNISLGCNARMTRQLVAFADPPELRAPAPTSLARAPLAPDVSVGVPAARSDKPAPPPVPVAAAPVANESNKSTRRERRLAARAVAAPVNVRVNVRAEERRTAQMAPAAPRAKAAPVLARKPLGDALPVSRPRLSPDIIEASLDLSPRLRLDTYERGAVTPAAVARNDRSLANVEASAVAALAASEAVSALQGQRVEVLERDLQKARSEAASSKNVNATLKARLEQSETSSQLTPVLGGLLALATAFAGWLAWRLRRIERERKMAWWNAQQAEALAAAGEPDYSLREPTSVAMEEDPEDIPPPSLRAAEAGAAVPAASAAAEGPAEFAGSSEGMETEPLEVTAGASHASIESLIDLEQQVEFFVVLGQDDSAVELLSEYLKTHGADAPLVHLRLLETLHRKGDVAGFERAANRMRKLFGGNVPAWAAQWDQGRSLEAFPEQMSRIKDMLATPALAMAALEGVMFNAQGEPALDLAAYRDALDLYAKLRDQQDQPTELAMAVASTPADAPTVIEAPSVVAVDHSLEWISSELGNLSGRPANEPPAREESSPGWQDSTAAAAHAASLFETAPTDLPRIDMALTAVAPAPVANNELLIDLDLSEAKPVKQRGEALELKLSGA